MLERFNKYWIGPSLAILTALSTYYFNVTKTQLEVQQKQLENVRFSLETELKRKDFENQQRFKLYDMLIASLEEKNIRKQRALVSLIDVVLADDSTLRNNFRDILLLGTSSDSVKRTITDIKNEEKQFFTATAQASEQNLSSFQIIVCRTEENGKESQIYAQKVFNELLTVYGKEKLSTAMLPQSINLQPAYKISANEIRYSSENENEAKRIKGILDMKKTLPLEPVRLRQVNQSSNVIKVYIRNM